MEATELNALRTWSARVCRYDDSFAVEGGGLWQPDTNIAQAFEVLDAVGEKLLAAEPDLNFRWWIWSMEKHNNTIDGKPLHTCKVETGRWYEHEMTWHESREMALILAAKAIWEATR